MTERFPPVSVVINTYNRGNLINDALLALERLDYPDYEVIVVNGPSTDETAAVLERWSGRIKLHDCPEANLSVSRNIGIEAAAGDIICFVDDDAAPHPQWLRRLTAAYADEWVGGVGGFTVDNTGVRWQVKKTLCDRFGNAYNVSDTFDERPLNVPGTPYYPSLLGTNSSFRAEALRQIGGFDHVFAYLLDETDVCLRLVDAGWKVVYEPTALVYHQFAPSHIRSPDRVPYTLLPSATSKGYFVMRHGAAHSLGQAGRELEKYRREIGGANRGLEDAGRIGERQRFILDQDIVSGLERGRTFAAANASRQGGDLKAVEPPPFLPMSADVMRVALVSQGFPPETEAGIARWTSMVARGLARRGHEVHVLTQSKTEESVNFVDGLWIHRMLPDRDGAHAIAAAYDIPTDTAAWCARVLGECQFLKSFGVRLVSFPIWDLEGLPLLDDPDLAAVISLHTTYALAKPFKPEWSARLLYEHHTVRRMIAAERDALARAPAVLANSRSIEQEIEREYGVALGERSTLVPHGTFDPLETRAQLRADRIAELKAGAPLRVLFVGRFEPRKGFDIVARVGRAIAARDSIELWIAGDDLDGKARGQIDPDTLKALEASPRVRFLGLVEREALDDLYVRADLLIAPSRFESFGLIGIEAMAAGTPVFALDVGGLAEVLEDRVTGRVFADGPDVASRMMAEIERLDADRDMLARMGRDARAAFEARYSVDAMVGGIESFFRSRISAHRKEKQDVAA